MKSLGNTWVRSTPDAVCAINTMQHLFHVWPLHHRTGLLLTELCVCSTTPQSATHSWVIVLHKGPGVCKAPLRADGYKPLWHRQTPNQVEHSEHRLHGKTRKLRVEILVSQRNRKRISKTQDQYISIIVGLRMEKALPVPTPQMISSLKKLGNRLRLFSKVHRSHTRICLTIFLKSQISLNRKRGKRSCLHHFVSIIVYFVK